MQTPNMPILLADAHTCSRIGLYQVLVDAGFEVIAEATHIVECLQLLSQHQPPLLLLACNLLSPDPFPLINILRQEYPNCQPMLYLANCDDLPLQALIDVGGLGMVTKTESAQTLLQMLWLAAKGQITYSPEVTKTLLTPEPTEAAGQLMLTTRQRQLLLLLTRGLNNSQIAAELCLSHQTVRNYLSQLYKLIDVSSRTEAVQWVQEHNDFYVGMGTRTIT